MTSPRVAFVAALLCIAAAPAPPTPGAVRARLAAESPKRTVAALSAGRGAGWEAVLRGVSRGDRRWIAIAPELAEGADAGASEALHAALSDALATAPVQVLTLTPATVTLDRLCGVPLIEPTEAQVVRYLAPRLLALSRVRGPARAKALECRRLLQR